MLIRHLRFTPKVVLTVLLVAAVLIMMFFMLYDLKGNFSYVLQRRAIILTTMLVVAFAAATSTLLFQTITRNRILSPAIMGFEALFILIQSSILFFWGEQNLNSSTLILKFLLEISMMMVFSFIAYFWLFSKQHHNLLLVLLVGIVCGSFFNSLASLIQRLLNPNEFAILQTRMFASFNSSTNLTLLSMALLVTLVIAIILWRTYACLDVLALGQQSAISLGLNYKKTVSLLLILISILVSVSTALVGPLTFFGFLVASLAYQLVASYQHKYLLPAAFLIGIIALAGGQFLLQHSLNMASTLSVVINFIGGTLFIILLFKRSSL